MKFLAFLALALAACSASPEQPSQELRIALSPAAQPVSAAVLACLPQDDGLAVTIDARFPSQVDLGEYDFYIQLGTPDERPGFAAQIATERIVFVSHPSLGLSSLGEQQAIDVLRGRLQNWSQVGGPDGLVLLFVPPEGDEARRRFEAIFVRGVIQQQALIITDPGGLLEHVAINATAAGILPRAWADERVRSHDFGVTLPVLALAAEVPQGAARGVLACLQSERGLEILSESYAP